MSVSISSRLRAMPHSAVRRHEPGTDNAGDTDVQYMYVHWRTVALATRGRSFCAARSGASSRSQARLPLRTCASESLQRMVAHVITDKEDRGEQDKLRRQLPRVHAFCSSLAIRYNSIGEDSLFVRHHESRGAGR